MPILEMSKIQVVVSMADKDSLLTELQKYGVLHVVPVSAEKAIADDQVAQQLADAQHAYAILNHHQPVEASSEDLKVTEVVAEVLANQKIVDDCRHKITANLRTIDNQLMWGDMSLADLEYLKSENKCPQFFVAPEDAEVSFDADFVTTLSGAPLGKKLVAVISSEDIKLPEDSSFEIVHLPESDNAALRAENKELEAKKAKAKEEINKLASHFEKVAKYVKDMESVHEYSTAANSGLDDSELYAIQGWLPTEKFDELGAELDKNQIHCGMRIVETAEEELPPTEVDYPKWTLPIKALFSVLGTLPGYHEPELSKFFMVAFPLFAAMIIGDAGYGLIFIALAFGMRDKLVKAAGKDMADLIKIIGITTFVWGILAGNIFGVTPANFTNDAGELTAFGKMYALPAIFWDMDTIAGIDKVTKLSFVIGCVHLVLAHLCQAVFVWPNKKAFAELGWVLVMVAMFGIIWGLFYPEKMVIPWNIILILLPAGLALAVIFTHPHNNPAVRVSVGLASSILPTIGAFGDLMSYIRLMAVGLASYYLAASFNQMGTDLFGLGIFGMIFGSVVIAFGHVLNIFLALIAVLAHGVRLNMLEFSGGAGIQWGGYAYEPFGSKK